MTDNNRILIDIPSDGSYIEILGYKIDGYDSFEAFCEHLNKYAELEETVSRQKAEIERLLQKLQRPQDADPMDFCGVLCDFAEGLIAKAKAEAYKECIEKIKKELRNIAKIEWQDNYCYLVGTTFFDNILMGMAGENDAE